MSKSEKRYIPVNIEYLQIRYSSVNIYNYFELNGYTPNNQYNNFKAKKTYNGTVGYHIRKRISTAVDLFLQASPKTTLYNPITKKTHPFQLNFITLTISNNKKVVTGKEGYKLLVKPFLTWLRDTKKIKTFIWKAEIQKRGQLHYHITLNQFLHLNEIKEKWNYLQQKNNLLNDYFLKNNHYNPNSTDVHSVYKIRKIDSYLCKYLSKPEAENFQDAYNHSKEHVLVEEIIQGNCMSCYPACFHNRYEINGKTWDCSDNLRGKKHFKFLVTDLNIPQKNILIKQNNLREYKNDFCTMLFGKEKWNLKMLSAQQLEQYNSYIDAIKTPVTT